MDTTDAFSRRLWAMMSWRQAYPAARAPIDLPAPVSAPRHPANFVTTYMNRIRTGAPGIDEQNVATAPDVATGATGAAVETGVVDSPKLTRVINALNFSEHVVVVGEYRYRDAGNGVPSLELAPHSFLQSRPFSLSGREGLTLLCELAFSELSVRTEPFLEVCVDSPVFSLGFHRVPDGVTLTLQTTDGTVDGVPVIVRKDRVLNWTRVCVRVTSFAKLEVDTLDRHDSLPHKLAVPRSDNVVVKMRPPAMLHASGIYDTRLPDDTIRAWLQTA